MSSIFAHSLNLDEEFVAACLAISTQVGNQSPIPPTDAFVSKATRLTNKYPNVYSDFYASSTPCVFKSGPNWRIRKGLQAQGIDLEARPVYRHAIGRTWFSVGKHTYQDLDSIGVKWKSINPLAYLDAREAKHRTTPDQRVIGFVLHSEKIEVSVELHGFTKTGP